MEKLLAFVDKLKKPPASHIFRATIALGSLGNLISFLLLFTSDCLHAVSLQHGYVHRLVAGSFVVSSYLALLIFSFLGIGYILLRTFRGKQVPETKNPCSRLAQSIAYPLLYLIFVLWGFCSLTGPVAWMGNLALGTRIAVEIVIALARKADKGPRPPRRRRRVTSLVRPATSLGSTASFDGACLSRNGVGLDQNSVQVRG